MVPLLCQSISIRYLNACLICLFDICKWLSLVQILQIKDVIKEFRKWTSLVIHTKDVHVYC